MITINESEQDGTSLQKPTWPDHRLWCLQGKTQSYSELVSLFLNHIFSLSKSYSEWASDVYLIAGIVWYQFLHSLSPSFKDSTGLHLPAKKDQQLYGTVRKVDFLRLFFSFLNIQGNCENSFDFQKNLLFNVDQCSWWWWNRAQLTLCATVELNELSLPGSIVQILILWTFV